MPDVYSQKCKVIVLMHALFLGICLLSTVYAGEITGRVSDADGSYYLTGAQVELQGTNFRTTTNANGEYRFAGVPAGDYTVIVSYEGAESFNKRITVPNTGLASLDARLNATDGMEIVLVVGQRASQASALSRQRSSDSISNFLTRDAIGQFPDQNVSESVRRLQGVSVQNDQGEGRFIVLRGLDPSLNSASINGARLPSPESDIRGVALDVIPSELIESIEVQKSLIPAMDADVIGGSVNINTTSALERSGPFLSITGSGSYNNLMDEFSPKLGIDASTLITDNIGISGGFSYYERQLGSENVEAEDWTDANDLIYAEEIQMRDYDVTRTRIGGTLGLDWRVSDATTLFARGIYSAFEDVEYRSRVTYDFGDAEPVSSTNGTRAFFNLGPGEELEVVRDIKDRTEKQVILSIVAGGETFADLWTFNYEASFSHAEEDEDDTFDTTDFARTFEEGELRITQGGLSSDTPVIRVGESSMALFTNPAEYEFDGVEAVDGYAEDEEISARLDITRDFNLTSGQLQVKAGGKVRFREKGYALASAIYDDYTGSGDFLLSDVDTTVDYTLNNMNLAPVPSASAVRGVLGTLSDFELNVADTNFERAANKYVVTEDIYASYLQARYVMGPATIIGGLRVETTKNVITGNRVDYIDEGGTFEGTTVDRDTVFSSEVEFTSKYTDYFPSLNVRYEASDQIVLRGAFYRSTFRPNVAQLAPRFVIEQDDEDAREGEFGNPDLAPYLVWNLDAGFEWYFADNSVIQGGVFYKDIKNPIFTLSFENVSFNGIFADEATIPRNLDSAEVFGLEANYQQVFSMLPSPFDGLLGGANYTYVDSQSELNGRKIPLTGTSENVFNLYTGYEKGPFSLRLSAVYRDEYLDEVSFDGETDRYIKDHFSVDFSAKYNYSDRLQLFMEWINITNEPYVAVFRTTDYGDRLSQYEEYSWTINTGIRFTY